MKLYYSKGSCSLAIRITIHELNLPCEFELVHMKDKKTERGVDFFTINPKGLVPVLSLDNGEILTENVAIQIYLAETHNAGHLLPHVGDFKRYHVLEALSFVSSDMHKSCGPLFNPNVPVEQKEKIFKPILETKLNLLEKHFSKEQYLVGNGYTLPDGYLYVVLTWFAHFNIDIKNWPHVDRFVNQILNRPSVQKSLAEGG